MIKAIILAGGDGIRLWPFSNQKYPKQFHKLFDDRSLFQLTVMRNCGKFFHTPVIITTNSLFEIVQKQLDEIKIIADIIVEPIAKNTAATFIIAALKELNFSGKLVVVPSDHVINNVSSYHLDILYAMSNNYAGLITFGIKPTAFHNGYGYLQIDEPIKNGNFNIYDVTEFKEKPDPYNAQKYLGNAKYLWNAGIYMFEPKTLIDLAAKHQPNMLNCLKQTFIQDTVNSNIVNIESCYYNELENISFDHAISEKCGFIKTIIANFDWSDIGNWQALWQVSAKDNNNNAVDGNILLDDVSNSYIKTDNKLTAVIGVKDIIVVNTNNLTLIMHKSKSEDVKKVAEYLKAV